MKKNYYYYKIFIPAGKGIDKTPEIVCYDTLKRARERAKELNIKEGYILRYHEYRGLEDKEYSL